MNPEIDPLPTEFIARIVGVHGDVGERWLAALPKLIEAAAKRWNLTIGDPFPQLSYNFVAEAVRTSGEKIVLKAGVPSAEFAASVAALRHFDGTGMVRLLAADIEHGVMLLERLLPGKPAAEIKDDGVATEAFLCTVQRMKKESPAETLYPTVSDWAKGFNRCRAKLHGDATDFPQAILDRAEQVMRELIAESGPPVLLHGDLHHWNILSAEREPWLAIDPQGVIGEIEYEAGAWLRNPFPALLQWREPKSVISGRLDLIHEGLGFEPRRLLHWSFSQSVLAAVWSFEESQEGWKGWLQCAELFEQLLRAN